MLCFPNAKINLGLQITEKRSDGFHNLFSGFYPVAWSDMLEILPAPKLHFTSSGIAIPDIEDNNLCLKAYHLLKKDFDIPPVHIHLHKIVPIGAGLGGGSSDATFTLKTLNKLFGLALSEAQLKEYARQLGSDCAFFVTNTPQYCYEKGDKMDLLQLDLSKYYIALIYPNIHISTKEAYSHIQPKMPNYDLKELLEEKSFGKWEYMMQNDFEEGLFANYPILQDIKTKLYLEYEALYAAMSGSGSTIFGIFDKPITIDFPKEYLVWQGSMKL